MNARHSPPPARQPARVLACLLLAAPALAAGPGGPHDTVQTRAECAAAVAATLGRQALVFDDPPQPPAPRTTDIVAEYWWRAWLVGDGGRTAVWLHCEIVPGATASHAEVLLRETGAP